MGEGGELVLLASWIRARLDAHASELDALVIGGSSVGDLSQRVFEDYAPEGTAYPFIIFQAQVPPRDVRGVGTTSIMVDTMYLVKAVSQSLSFALLAPVAMVIQKALTSESGGKLDEGEVFASVREEVFRMTEVSSGKQYRHLGGLYRIHAKA